MAGRRPPGLTGLQCQCEKRSGNVCNAIATPLGMPVRGLSSAGGCNAFRALLAVLLHFTKTEVTVG